MDVLGLLPSIWLRVKLCIPWLRHLVCYQEGTISPRLGLGMWDTLCHVPNFELDHNGLITFSIFMRFCQIDAKGQIIAKEENYQHLRLGLESSWLGIRETINDLWTLEWNKYLIKEINKKYKGKSKWQLIMKTHGGCGTRTSYIFYATWHPPLVI